MKYQFGRGARLDSSENMLQSNLQSIKMSTSLQSPLWNAREDLLSNSIALFPFYSSHIMFFSNCLLFTREEENDPLLNGFAECLIFTLSDQEWNFSSKYNLEQQQANHLHRTNVVVLHTQREPNKIQNGCTVFRK